ncbi:MAG: VCBS repeat-containing protein [Actinomycetota bacterium]
MVAQDGSFGRHLHGRRAGAAFVAVLALLSVVVVAPGSSAQGSARTLRVAVVLYEDDGDRAPVSAADVERTFFAARNGTDAATGSVADYLEEVSDGQVSVTGDVFGWYDVTDPADAWGARRCLLTWEPDLEPLHDDLRSRAAADGFVESSYDLVLFASSVPACGYRSDPAGGTARSISAMGAAAWARYAVVLLDELAPPGELVPVDQAFEACQRPGPLVSWGGRCGLLQGGDPFSTTGAANSWYASHRVGHPSAFVKLDLGYWDLGVDVRQVRTSGRYRLRPASAPPGGDRGLLLATRAEVAIDRDGRPDLDFDRAADLAIEYRTAERYDTSSHTGPGVYVRVAQRESGTGWATSHLIDADPATGDWDLPAGTWFSDGPSGVRFRVVPGTATATGVDIEVVVEPTTNVDGDGTTDLLLHRPTGSWNTMPTLASVANGWRPTNFSTAGEVNAPGAVAVPVSLDGRSPTDVVVHRPGSGSRTLVTARGEGSGRWTRTSATVPSWVNASGVVVVPGDFDRNSLTDLAFYRPGSSWRSTPVLLRRDDGGWDAVNRATPSWANQPGVVAVPGDFDGDGLTDLMFSRPGGPWNTSPVLFADGAGGWTATNSSSPSWANQPGVVAFPGQFDGDGLTDIAFLRPGGGWASIPVLHARGDGTWRATNQSAPRELSDADAVAVTGSFDGDGLTDLAVLTGHGSGSPEVRVASPRPGTSWSVATTSFTWTPTATELVLVPARLDADVLTDLVVHRPGSGTGRLFELVNDGARRFLATDRAVPGWVTQPDVVVVGHRGAAATAPAPPPPPPPTTIPPPPPPPPPGGDLE